MQAGISQKHLGLVLGTKLDFNKHTNITNIRSINPTKESRESK